MRTARWKRIFVVVANPFARKQLAAEKAAAVARRDQSGAIVYDQQNGHARPAAPIRGDHLYRHEAEIDRSGGEERHPDPRGEWPPQRRRDEGIGIGGSEEGQRIRSTGDVARQELEDRSAGVDLD